MVLILSLAAAWSQSSPAELLESIQEKLRKAKTVSVSVTVERNLKLPAQAGGMKTRATAEGRYVSQSPGRFKISLSLRSGTETRRSRDLTVVSDGSRLQAKAVQRGKEPETKTFDSKGSKERLFVQVGVFHTIGVVSSHKVTELDLDKVGVVTGVKQGLDSGEVNSLQYTLALGNRISYDVTLWYNPTTLNLVRRKLDRRPTDGEDLTDTIIERYNKVELNGEVSDTHFVIPPGK